jgi:hyperosmotically inducible protein
VFAPLIAFALSVASFQQPSDGQVSAWIAGDLQKGASTESSGARLSAAGLSDDLTVARQVGGRLTGAGAHSVVVGVHRGDVVLDGQVPDQAERSRMLALASAVDGVRSVTDRLLLPGQPPLPSPTPAAATPAGPSRSEPFDFLTPDNFAGRGVVVDVVDGVATLTGTANSVEASRYATVTAQCVPGVRAVRNRLDVLPTNRGNDRRLALMVQRELGNDVIVQTVSNALMVSVDHGVARLTGRVRDAGQLEQAGRVATGISAVFAVDNQIVVDENLVLPVNGRIPGFVQFHAP